MKSESQYGAAHANQQCGACLVVVGLADDAVTALAVRIQRWCCKEGYDPRHQRVKTRSRFKKRARAAAYARARISAYCPHVWTGLHAGKLI